MKHTSIRLSEAHTEKIAATGQSPTNIIKKALDLYFDMPPDDQESTRKLIEEHVKLYHRARPEHVVSTQNKHVVPQPEHAARAQDEHRLSTDKPQSLSVPQNVAQDEHMNVPIVAHNLSTEARQALSFIAAELREGREPTTAQVAEKVQMTQTGISRKLGELGISSQNTRREMKSVRIYPKHMLARIEEIFGKE
jgi:hypothetical protein